MKSTARAGRVVVACALAVAPVVAPAAAWADAGTAQPPAVATNWYWFGVQPSVGGNAAPAGLPTQASTVPDGDLGVGYSASQTGPVDKLAAVGFDISAVPALSTFSAFSVALALDPDAHQVMQAQPALVACENIDAFKDAPGPSALSDAPPLSTPSCVKGTFDAKVGKAGGYVFSLEGVANDWSAGTPNHGISVLPDPAVASPQPFTLSFLGKNGITVQAAYTTPDAAVVTPPTTTTEPPPTVPSVIAPPPVFSGSTPIAPMTPVADAPVVVPAPQVNVAPAAPVQALARPAAFTMTKRPGNGFWLALLAGAGLLGLVSLALGDPLVPAPVTRGRRTVEDVVRSHHEQAAQDVRTPSTSRPARRATSFRPA